jgi:ABC-type Fe3+ transport system permease subunit
MFGSVISTSIMISAGALFVVVILTIEHIYLSSRKRQRG